MSHRLFLYGTLKPGHEAWPVVEPFAHDVAPTTVAGRLYDTGAGYPAAVFDPVGTPITGVAVTLVAELAETAFGVLDRYEGHEYRRTVVADSHGPLFAYEWIGPSNRLVELPSGCWAAPI